MNGKNYGSKIYSLFSLVVLFIFCCEVTKAQSEPKKSPYQLPNGQYSAPTPNAIPADISFVHFDKPVFPPIPFDSAMNTGIFGEIKRTDGETQTIFYLKTEPMPEHDRIIANGTKFLLLNEWLTPKRSFNKILVKILSNPPSNQFVGDTGWVEVSHTSLYPYYDNAKNKIDPDYVYKKYTTAAANFRNQAKNTTCADNKKCYTGYAEYFECMAESEKNHTEPKCKRKDCTIEDCPGDELKK